MATQKVPLTGGSYIRAKDGSLKRSAGTADAPEPVAAAARAAPAAAPTETTAPADLKKGK